MVFLNASIAAGGGSEVDGLPSDGIAIFVFAKVNIIQK